MAKLFDSFSYLRDSVITIRKMRESDADDLMKITESEAVYRFIPFLYKKSRGHILAAIRNIGERDFVKQKMIVAGICLNSDDRLIALFEIFDFKKRSGTVTIGYKVSERCWNRGIATRACGMTTDYLSGMNDVCRLTAYVMPENVYSAKVLLTNGFEKMPYAKEDHNWGQRENVLLDVYEYAVRH